MIDVPWTNIKRKNTLFFVNKSINAFKCNAKMTSPSSVESVNRVEGEIDGTKTSLYWFLRLYEILHEWSLWREREKNQQKLNSFHIIKQHEVIAHEFASLLCLFFQLGNSTEHSSHMIQTSLEHLPGNSLRIYLKYIQVRPRNHPNTSRDTYIKYSWANHKNWSKLMHSTSRTKREYTFTWVHKKSIELWLLLLLLL